MDALRKKCAQEILKLIWTATKMPIGFPQKVRTFPAKICKCQCAHQISESLPFMNVTHRIKSQLLRMRTFSSANHACFKYLQTNLMSQIFVHVSGFESLVAPISYTTSGTLRTQWCYYQQFQWLNCQRPCHICLVTVRTAVKSSRFVEHVYM